jgi:glyoxylase-like metal-dependent hydrolase (beta-lactamase superfamily II)
MKITTIDTGYFKLDGGAMFGVIPKVMWQKLNPADEHNLVSWSLRCLLIEEGDRKILIDTGLGNKQDAKFFSHYHLHGTETLESSLAKYGIKPTDITDVIHTHLHFDHCGGAINWNESKDGYRPAFPNATYWSTEQHWKWATEPNPREKASFLAENILPIQESGQLKFIDRTGDYTKNAFPNMDVLFVDGHTESMMIPHIQYQGKTLVFMADLLPSTGHVPLPYVMGYDTRPLITMEEKKNFLNKASNENYVLFLEHDSVNECCTLTQTEKGVRLKEQFSFNELFS